MALTVARNDLTESAKLIIKDLPLHEILNQDILAALKENFDVLSDVKYGNIFINGKHTHLRNSDHFVYISLDQIDKVPLTLHCKAFIARIIKPMQFQTCHRCGQTGHKAASPDCPTLAPDEVQQTIQPFCGSQNE